MSKNEKRHRTLMTSTMHCCKKMVKDFAVVGVQNLNRRPGVLRLTAESTKVL